MEKGKRLKKQNSNEGSLISEIVIVTENRTDMEAEIIKEIILENSV